MTPPATAQTSTTPVRAALSWFAAINRKDKAAAIAAFVPSAAEQMNWGNGDTATWPTFTAIKCTQQNQDAATATATVYCTFSESQAPAAGNPDTFWTVYFQRTSDGRWPIDNYGQG